MNVNSFRIGATTSAFVYGKSEEIKKLVFDANMFKPMIFLFLWLFIYQVVVFVCLALSMNLLLVFHRERQ